MYQVASSEFWSQEKNFFFMGERSKLPKQDNTLLLFVSMCGRLIPLGLLADKNVLLLFI